VRAEGASEYVILEALDCRRTLEDEERRDEEGRTASMTLLKENGMVIRGEEARV
jgi:hypothetical protein